MVEEAISANGFKIVSSKIDSESVDELKQVSDSLRQKLGSGVGVLSSIINDKASFVCVVTDDLINSKKLSAGDIVKKVAAVANGTGGGRPHLAIAGGKDIKKISKALEKVPEIVTQLIKK